MDTLDAQAELNTYEDFSFFSNKLTLAGYIYIFFYFISIKIIKHFHSFVITF